MTAWYSTGTIAVPNGGTTVTGTGTDFVANVAVAEGIRLPDGLIYQITAIGSATSLTISKPYAGTTVASGGAYEVAPMQGWVRTLALQASALLSTFGDVRDNAGQGIFAHGTAGAPGLRGISDPDTGLRWVGSNVLALVTGGADRVTVDGSGRVGIGTTSPQYPIDVSAGSGAAGARVYTSGTTVNLDLEKASGGIATVRLSNFGGVFTVGDGTNEFYRSTATATQIGGATNTSGSGTAHCIIKGTTQNIQILDVAGVSGSGVSVCARFFTAAGASWNAAASAMKVGNNTSTGRSLDASGTVNPSGADPAEYHFKAPACPTIAKGQVVGIDAQDRVTDRWADACDFGIKSADPSVVGGNRWGSEASILAVHGAAAPGPRPEAPVDPGDDATEEEASAYAAALSAYTSAMIAWESAAIAFDTAYELERQKVDRISHGGGRLPCIVAGTVTPGHYVIAQDDGSGGIEAICAATVADADRWRIVGRVRIADPTEAQIRALIREEVVIDPAWNAIVVQMKG